MGGLSDEDTSPWISKRETLQSIGARSIMLGNSHRRGFSNLINKFKRRHVAKGKIIINQGNETSKSYFAIESGTCEVWKRNSMGEQSMVKSLCELDTFGEYSFIYRQARAASVIAKTDCVVWECDAEDIEQFVELNNDLATEFEQKRDIRKTISDVHWFAASIDDERKIQELIDTCTLNHFEAGEVVLKQGEKDEGNFYVVQDGELDVLVSKNKGKPVSVAHLTRGNSFGELALLNKDTRRNATIRALNDVVLLSVTRKQFHRLARLSCVALWRRFNENASIKKDGTRFMTMADLVKSLGTPKTSERAIELVFEAADSNYNHHVSWTEFVLLTGLLLRPHADLHLAFLFCDLNGDGVVSRQEFSDAMRSLLAHQHGTTSDATRSLPIDSKSLDKVFGDSDTLSYAEFIEEDRRKNLTSVAALWHRVIADAASSQQDILVSAIDTGEFIVMPGHTKMENASNNNSLQYLICGGTAGAVSRLMVAPIIRVKMLMQTQTKIDGTKVTGIVQGCGRMLKAEGWRACFKGAGTNTVRIVPTTALQFMFFETFKSWIGQGEEISIPQRLFAGGFAGIGGAICTYPLDFIRARLTVQSTSAPEYNGIIHGLRTVVAKEGIRAVYRGLWPTILGVFPYLGIDFAIYETMKHSKWCPRVPNSEQRTISALLFCGGVAGLVSQTFAFPLELVRRRLQTQGFGGADFGYRGGVYDALQTTVRKEGLKGLYRGLSVNYVKAVPSIGIGFVVYERMKHALEIS